MHIDYFKLFSNLDLDLDLDWSDNSAKREGVFKRINQIVNYKDMNLETIKKVNKLIKKIVNKKKLHEHKIEVCQLQKTSTNGFFDWHNDFAEGRTYLCIVYLSDCNDGLVGGTTEFKYENKIKTIFPQKGYCCFFDSKLWHKGNEVLQGEKYSLVLAFNKNLKEKTKPEIASMGNHQVIYRRKFWSFF